MNLDKIKNQLRHILAKAEDGSGATEAEAANALEFAQRMIMRHQLTAADIGPEKERTASEIAADTEYDEVVAFAQGGNLSRWESTLGAAVNNLVGTTQSYHGGKGEKRSASGNLEFDGRGQPKVAARLMFYGPASDCRDATELFSEWAVTISALARMKFGGAFRGPGRSYAEGFAVALYNKTQAMKKANRELIEASGIDAANIERRDAALLAQNEDEGAECSALVVIKSTELIVAKKDRGSDWLRNEKGIKLCKRSAGSGGRHYGDAYGSGQSDGKNANFNRTRTKQIGS